MARQEALGVLTGVDKDQLQEIYGDVIEYISKNALSVKYKNTKYSGNATAGSVEISRFANAKVKNYGTARTAGKGDSANNSGKVTINVFKRIWDEIMVPIIQPFLEQFSWLWDNYLSGAIETVLTFVAKLVNSALEIYNKFIEPIVGFLVDSLAPTFTYAANIIAGVIATLIAALAGRVDSIFTIFNGLIDFITGVFTGDWRKAWQGVVDIFGGIFKGIVEIIKLPINLIIDGLNAFIRRLNRIKIPDWVPFVGGNSLNISRIPKLAQGGIVDKATLAIVGEQGKEAVMPLERNKGWKVVDYVKITGRY
ncbi:MAG: hypothetical protein ACK5G7_05765 [Erysipelotrichaceae bacterium]